MTDICLSCFGRLPDDSPRTGCEACEYRAHTWLRELPRHLPLLTDMLRPDTGPAQRGGTGRAHAPLPIRLDVLDLLGPGQPVPIADPHGDQTGGIPMTALLMGWARYLAQEHQAVRVDQHGTVHLEPCTGPWPRGGATVPALCRWLDAYLPYAVGRPWWDDLYEQVEQLIRRVRRITHTTPRTRALDAPCPQCSGWSLVEKEDELHISCTLCPALLTPDEYAAHRTVTMASLARTVLLTLDTSAA
ncbi:hypothetical protein [Streptomyces cyaneofuscatus]|uniref:hypothetical protein n=1 Tax=Streptomyces cyaneofuscatus TaxID=66883 RepID=UPI00381F6E82